MEDQAGNAFNFSDFRIQDGFKFGDWRDQWVTDKSFDDWFSARKSLLENQDWIGRLLQIFDPIFHERNRHFIYSKFDTLTSLNKILNYILSWRDIIIIFSIESFNIILTTSNIEYLCLSIYYWFSENKKTNENWFVWL